MKSPVVCRAKYREILRITNEYILEISELECEVERLKKDNEKYADRNRRLLRGAINAAREISDLNQKIRELEARCAKDGP